MTPEELLRQEIHRFTDLEIDANDAYHNNDGDLDASLAAWSTREALVSVHGMRRAFDVVKRLRTLSLTHERAGTRRHLAEVLVKLEALEVA